MPLKRSEAFVLDTRRLREADRIVTFFTEDEGKLKGVAASAAKSRRRFGGSLERLSRVRVTYFEKEGADLARIDSCDLLDESFTLHQDLRLAATLAYIAEIADTFTHERESDRRYFRLLGATMEGLRRLGAGGDPGTITRYFEVWTLKLHGLLPDLERCAACARDLSSTGAVIAAGGMASALCPACGRGSRWQAGEPGGRRVRLSRAAMEALGRFRKLAPADLTGIAPPRAASDEIEEFAVALMTSFVGHPFRSYRFLRECSVEEVP